MVRAVKGPWGNGKVTGKMSKSALIGAGLGALAWAMPATAQGASTGAPTMLGSATEVSAFYGKWNAQPIWLRGGPDSALVQSLVSILQRAPFDGFAAGPQLAAQVQAAAASARTGRPADIAAADRLISSAWVQYVQAIKQPTSGMYYAYPTLAPQGRRADQILLTAAASKSLESHIRTVSNINPLYAAIRDAGFAQAQAAGQSAPDARLLANLDRARSIPGKGRVAVVEIASQRLLVFENGVPVDSMKIIVGMTKYPTPLIASYISYVTLNPYWDSPDHLVKEAIAPNVLRQGFGYLKARGYEAMADWSPNAAVLPPEKVDWKAVAAGKLQLRIRQKPGPENFMATMKIPFVNDDDIYLHDTPTKSLFAKANRALSNGCVRLEAAPRFARWLLLGRDPIAAAPDLPEQHVKLPQSVPVYLTYLTAQPEGGKLTYLADVYGLDKAAAKSASLGSSASQAR
jgi:murein L,D-transpeptidase YcbB/YkuD